MATYNVTVGGLPQASDVNQLVDIFSGKHDIGTVTFAPALSAPALTGFSLMSQAGTTLPVGSYTYVYTWITGYYKSDGTLVKTGETTQSTTQAFTTTANNQTIMVMLPTSGTPASAVAIGIYRSAIANATPYGLIATVKIGNTSYNDSTLDSARGAAPPASNTTGTSLGNMLASSITLNGNSGSAHIVPISGGSVGFTNNAQTKWGLRVADGTNPAAYTVSNTLDDGSGNMTIAGTTQHNNTVKIGSLAATASPIPLIVQNWSNVSAGSAQIIGGWQGTNYWGIGTDSSSADLTVKIGNTNGSGAWQSTNVELMVTGNIGSGINPAYGLHTLGGQARFQALANPSAPTVTTVGTAGTTSYSYYVVATDRNGYKTAVSAVTTITTGNATLNATNYNTISWAAVPGAVSYDVLKADINHSIATGLTGTSYNDQGAASSAYTAPLRNATADFNLDGILLGAVPYIFIASATVVNISSVNTLTNVAINNNSFLGQAGSADLTLGHDANGDYVYVPHAGIYVIQAQLFISGLNNAQLFQFLSRRYLANQTYGDDQQGMYGYQGLGGNQGSGKQGLPFTYQSAWACDGGDKIYFWTQCTEAPRTINGYNILIQKVG